jgi:hypothetical protein
MAGGLSTRLRKISASCPLLFWYTPNRYSVKLGLMPYIAQREGTHVARNKRLRRAGRDDRVAEPARLGAELAERGASEAEDRNKNGGGAHDDVVIVMGRGTDAADRQTSTRAFIRRACGV